MLRKLVCSTSRASAACTVTLVGGCRLLTTHHSSALRSASLQAATHTTLRPALLLVRRAAATAAQQNSASDSALTDDEIISAANWQSPQFEERLGFRGGDAITEERLKRHYYVLAKHFHPDTAAASSKAGAGDAGAAGGSTDSAAGGPTTSAEAFQNIKEAYDAISSALKSGRAWSGGGGASAEENANARDFAGGFTYADDARRRSQVRLLGETVMLFVAMTVLLIFIVSRHNKTRMQSRYLWHLVWIFFMIQLFPRLLAAAILFASHSMYLLDNQTLKEQAAISLIVERRPSECTVKLDGIRAQAVPHVVVQVTTTARNDTLTKTGDAEEVSSVLTFDKGVTEFLLPVPAKQHAVYHIKAVDEERKVVLVDRTVSALD